MKIPKEVEFVLKELRGKGFESYVVGGCVRDVLMNRLPQDWDIATNANPNEISSAFKNSFSDNKFGTVTVLTESKDETLKEIEVTPFRTESKYTDKRHPDEVKWAKTIEEDLSRRDFTINSIALGQDKKVIDPFKGKKDIEDKIIRAVGNPEDRFSEDALRMIRAVRLSALLQFKIEEKTKEAIKKNSNSIDLISKERVRDEFLKIIMADKADEGIELLRTLSLLKYIIPELQEGFKVGQNKHHVYEVYEHSILSLKCAADKKFNMYVRIASLFHDIGKPRAKRGEGPDSTFYGHETIGAKITGEILNRLRFSKKDIEKIVKLVRYHLFYYNVDEVSESSVRRLVKNVGQENMEELLQVRICDRIGSGVPKAEPYKLRHLKYVIDKVSQDPISTKMLEVSGNDVMSILSIKPSRKVGEVLSVLLSEVLSDPKKNQKKYLEKEIKKLGEMNDRELSSLAKESEEAITKVETKKDEMTKQKYWVT